MHNKIAIIIPYFGKWPEWMNFYLHTCSANPIIDILFFSDIPFNPEWIIPSNVKYFNTTFTDYCRRISESLKITFTPINPYKLCDIKPFYGYIHQKELSGYDFWGFGDIDLIYGNISNFINDTILEKFDYISMQSDRVSGHLFFARNKPEITEKIFKVKKLNVYLIEQKYSGVDERYYFEVLAPSFNKLHKLRRLLLKLPFKRKQKIICFYNILVYFMQFLYGFKRKRMFFKEMYTTLLNYSNNYLYTNKKIIDMDRNKEIIYLHFLGLKKYFWPENNAILTINTKDLQNNNILIDKSGFHIQNAEKQN